MKSVIGLVVGTLLFGGLFVRFASQMEYAAEPQATDKEDPGVAEAEFELYLAVYNAMQDDHGLAIEEVLEPHGMNLQEFRGLERRIQKEQRYVDRVREELLEHAKNRTERAARPPDGEDLGPNED